ncbi:hypothetical protein DdX_17275 [Ditylenchus destructor]|uniref:Uncharacterized protein n=1 Tax=Ditylenchus destructor TaxID=166010 RepID=A0AAD4MMN3_9BILA|nr:hypothetical protein DdX_17275 [Ditylenchus destructor]
MSVRTASFILMIVALLVKDAKATGERDVTVSIVADGSVGVPVEETAKISIEQHSVRSIVEQAKTKVAKSKYWTDSSQYEFSHADFSYAQTTNPTVPITIPINELDKKDIRVSANNVSYKLAVHMKKKE